MLMPLHHFCHFNFKACETFMIVLYLLKTVSFTHYLQHVSDDFWLFCYCLCFTYIQMHIFSSEFIICNFLHMFVLPDVASSGVAGVWSLLVIFFIPHVPCWFTVTLHIILSCKFYFVFSYDIRCISITCMHIC